MLRPSNLAIDSTKVYTTNAGIILLVHVIPLGTFEKAKACEYRES